MSDIYQDTSNELKRKAYEFTIQNGFVSVAMLQRKFKICYVTARSIVDEMKAAGIITGPNDKFRWDVVAHPTPPHESIAK